MYLEYRCKPILFLYNNTSLNLSVLETFKSMCLTFKLMKMKQKKNEGLW